MQVITFDNLMIEMFRNKSAMEEDQRCHVPSMDVVEKPNSYSIKLDLPGLAKEHINISLKDQVLTVSGERKSEQADESNENGFTSHISERAYGRFERKIRMPETADLSEEKASASMENGVLEIVFPKKVDAVPKTILIR
ncbi:MAG: hypothetical protein SGCHY_005414 [Lobulomycetales sp.]